ncbi:hypothetical protein P154DRAFT_611410 [Amniculicola lignicola CBS 123094]|uniref:Uncharacterized protein n=1 Tax=Amniculicola lignicola CBS 123094 TaxID=1392246 RepID=A0A6A5W1V6_9PLEO|nr:hypothetical protein P154DRAFT_611410 [Amniculicola lignicola CBS 123094]
MSPRHITSNVPIMDILEELPNRNEPLDLLEHGTRGLSHMEILTDEEQVNERRKQRKKGKRKGKRKGNVDRRPERRKKRRGPDEDETDTEPDKPMQSRGSRTFRSFVRSFRLQFLAQFTPWWPKYEVPKVAFYRRSYQRHMRALVLHTVPLLGALALFFLNVISPDWRDNYIPPKLRIAIPFIAKFHEMLMQTSIATILLVFINKRIRLGFVPFGWLFAPRNVAAISYLWSAEYLSGWTSVALPTFGKRLWGVFVITLGILLASTCGPSSTIAMMPKSVEVYLGTGPHL